MADDRLRALMCEYQDGRFEAFDELYSLLAPALRRYLLGQARDAARAEDLLQDTFLQLHRARHTYDPAYPLTPWAIAIARHVWLMDRRTQSRRPWAPEDVTTMELPVRGEASAYAEKTDVRRALGQVSASRRTAVVQHHVLGLSFKEIAEKAGIAEAAAKLRSSRGMAQLRSLLHPTTQSPRRGGPGRKPHKAGKP
jgi:RNA polymerase sigma-70 factor, ECF subfamily